MKIKSIKAFTIGELMVAMLLLSIIFSIVLSLLNIFNKQLNSYEYDNQKALELERFKNYFQASLYHAQTIQFNDNIIQCNRKDGNEYYWIDKNAIVWKTDFNTSRADTFHFEKLSVNLFFKKELVRNGWVDKFTFETALFNQNISLPFYKNYSSSDYLSMQQQ